MGRYWGAYFNIRKLTEDLSFSNNKLVPREARSIDIVNNVSDLNNSNSSNYVTVYLVEQDIIGTITCKAKISYELR